MCLRSPPAVSYGAIAHGHQLLATYRPRGDSYATCRQRFHAEDTGMKPAGKLADPLIRRLLVMT